MPLDYQRMVDGLSAATRMLNEGAAGVTVIDTLICAAREASGAAGATFIEFAEEGGRVVAGSGAMAWAAGQPVSEKVLERGEAGPWVHDTAVLPGRTGTMLVARGLRACVGFAVRADGRSYGSVNLFFTERDCDFAPVEPVLRLVTDLAARAYAPPPRPTEAGLEEDDRTLFLAVAGHELRTPVTVVKGYARMLADRWDSLDEANRQAGAHVLAQRADELARLVDRMLGASVGDGPGARLVRTEPFDVLEAVRQAAYHLPDDLRGAVRLDLPGELPTAYGDAAMMNPVITELVTNAIRQTPERGLGAGSALMGASDAAPPVEISAGADPQTVYVRVSDRGLGIDPSHVERVFERFWRAPREHDPRNGVGLGLYLVRRLVERQNGWVSLRPREGGGTVAEVRFGRVVASQVVAPRSGQFGTP